MGSLIPKLTQRTDATAGKSCYVLCPGQLDVAHITAKVLHMPGMAFGFDKRLRKDGFVAGRAPLFVLVRPMACVRPTHQFGSLAHFS
jgi:hypothetical protein